MNRCWFFQEPVPGTGRQLAAAGLPGWAVAVLG